MNKTEKRKAIQPFLEVEPEEFIPIDDWTAEPEDEVFKTNKGKILLNVSEFYGYDSNTELDSFYLTSKKSYNNPKMRAHMCHYLNYFIKYYDKDHELLMIYYKLKYLIDYEPNYNKEAFFYDLERYIMSGTISLKTSMMNSDCYSLNLTYKNKRNPSLQYNDKHALMLMKISIIMNQMIPLVCHFMVKRNILNSTDFLLELYDILISKFDADIYNKLYETSISNVLRSEKRNMGIWKLQDIRGINTTTHAIQCCSNILINIIPKYIYSENLVHFNYKSIQKNTGFQILDIEYECSFIPLSSSKRDEDNNNEFDRYESFLTKSDESLFLQSTENAAATMELIELLYGPFDPEEIIFYEQALSTDGKCVVNDFQRDLIFNLFDKYFGDPECLKSINLYDYIKLLITARTILEANGLVLLPYIISGRVERLTSRKSINKKELVKLESSPIFNRIKEKYKNDKIIKQILGIIAMILTSDFKAIDYQDPEINGMMINIVPELICEEVLLYVSLI